MICSHHILILIFSSPPKACGISTSFSFHSHFHSCEDTARSFQPAVVIPLGIEVGRIIFSKKKRVKYMGVSTNKGFSPKMDGLFHGKPY